MCFPYITSSWCIYLYFKEHHLTNKIGAKFNLAEIDKDLQTNISYWNALFKVWFNIVKRFMWRRFVLSRVWISHFPLRKSFDEFIPLFPGKKNFKIFQIYMSIAISPLEKKVSLQFNKVINFRQVVHQFLQIICW